MSTRFEWETRSGDAWAERWRDTDRALEELGAKLDQAIFEAAPDRPFRALDVGCGAGATSLALAAARPDASLVGCDLSPALVQVARERGAGLPQVRFHVGDVVQLATQTGPYDLIFSRHGVMFFPDPAAAFRALRACADGGAALVFSCFQSWEVNPWASDLAEAAAGKPLPPPGREPSGFAFADPAYVQQILESAGWAQHGVQAVSFDYVPGAGADAVSQALAFLAEIGPASSVVRGLPEAERPAALARMRDVIERHCAEERVTFPAAALIWSARAEGERR